jgi:CO/xanthine dehydrogenase FAD-binding subunit
MGRMSNIFTGAVIDYKEIPECKALEMHSDCLIIGSGVTLTQIHESNLFSLLALAGARVADHTIQNKITLGGNLCGTIIYREAVLPLLLADSEIITAGPKGIRVQAIQKIFNQTMQLGLGEFIIQVRISKPFLSYSHFHVKRTKQDKITYPLVTICAMKVEKKIRVAFSGVCDFPFRSIAMEEKLNNTSIPMEKRVDDAISLIPAVIKNDIEGSAEYRQFVLSKQLLNILNTMGEKNESNTK